MVEDALQHDGNVLGAEGKGDTTKSSFEKAYVEESSEREHKKTGNDCSYGNGEMEAPDHFDQQLMVEDDLQHDGNVLGAEGKGDTTKSSLEKAYAKNSSEREHKKIGYDISYEVLEQNFGRPLEDVARSLGVSRSTFKRLLRKHNISRWPSHKRNKVCGPSFNDKMPHMQATNDVAHTVPHVIPVQDMNMVTVKATYNDVDIKFQLSLSAGMAELEENVIKRLHLERRKFSIKYKDDEDDCWYLVACDETLQDCMNNARLKNIAIRMLVGLPITHLAP